MEENSAPRKWRSLLMVGLLAVYLGFTDAATAKSDHNADYWLVNTHSTTCSKFTVRTFLVEHTDKDDILSLVIRQNTRGRILVKELPKGPASNHKIQVALNWTAPNNNSFSALQNEYEVKGETRDKTVLMQVYVGDIKSKMNLSPVVIGGSVTGFIVMMGLIFLALYFARRRGHGAEALQYTSSSQSSSAVGGNTSTYRHSRLSLFRGGNHSSTDIELRHLTADEGEEGEDTDFYHPSTYYMTASAREDDTSLDLSGMPDVLRMDESHDVTITSLKDSTKTDVHSCDESPKHSRAEYSKYDAELPPPPPPPPVEFDVSGSSFRVSVDSNPYEDISMSSMKRRHMPIHSSSKETTSDRETTSDKETTPNIEMTPKHSEADPTYAPIDKNRPKPPTTLPPPLAQSSDAESEQSFSRESRPRHHGSGGGGGGGGGYLGSTLLGRTVMVVCVLSVVAQCVYTLCHDDVSVEIMIFIPPDVKINSIHLYSNRHSPSVFHPTPWYVANIAKFRTFDLDQVDTLDPSVNSCTPKTICPTAPNQTHLGCDWKTQKCVCKRGWELNNQQVCVDVNECEMGRCPPNMQCTNSPGSYSCTCNQGLFWNGDHCQTCTVGCGEGFYQVSPCNITADRACHPCSKCMGASFTYKPCNGIEDTQCVAKHVSLKTSPNVFVEKLHDMEDKNHLVFATSNSLLSKFSLTRDSGVRILGEVKNFSLIPEFTDVAHENDNAFVQNAIPEQKAQLNKIIFNDCRSPIPDYYILTMNKFKDRTTVVQDVVCNSTLMNCPPRFSDGQIYRFRTYNTQCPKTTKNLKQVQNEGNSVACNERTPLLADIFNETLTRDNPLSFPSMACQQSIWKCKDCFNNYKCGELGANESCCAVSCHAQRDCKDAASDKCYAAPIECATGDTVQFLLQPVFENLNRQFQCHIKRKLSKSIFRLSYRIVVPTPDEWTSSIKTVDLPTAGESEATQISDFLTVEYNNYLRTTKDGDMLLRGDYNSINKDYDYTLFAFKPRSEFNKTKVRPIKYEILKNQATITANIQNERPFEISTWNFNSKHGCYADTSKIHGRQLMYNESSGQRVQVYKVRENSGLSYDIHSLDKSPLVNIVLPGSQSVLGYYFHNSTLDYGTVSVRLVDRNEPFYTYSILVSGSMTSCNSYLAITLFDKTTELTVTTYDTLIYCTALSNSLPTFNFDLKIPEEGSQDKLFAVTLRDSHTTVSYFVTTYSYSTSLRQNNTIDLYNMETTKNSNPITFFAMLICLAVLGVVFGIVYFFISYKIISVPRFNLLTNECQYSSAKRHTLVALYCVFKIIYSVVFSLTVLVLLLQVVCRQDLEHINEMPAYHIEIKQMVQRNIQAVTDFKQQELKRQHEMRVERLSACGDSSLNTVNSMRSSVLHYSEVLQKIKEDIETRKFDRLMTEIQEYLKATKTQIDKHKKDVDAQITDIFSDYNRLLDEMVDNSWLNIPFLNYKHTANKTSRAKYGRDLLSAEAVDFLSYLGVDRPASALQQVQLLNQQLDMVYQGMMVDIEKNIGLGILQDLNTDSLSTFTLKKYSDSGTVSKPAFSIEKELKIKTSGSTAILYIIVAVCDILLFIYRMCSLSHTVYRLNRGFAEEVEISSADNIKSAASIRRDNLQIEMTLIKKQIVGDEEMSRSLLDDVEQVDENLNLQEAGNSKILQKQRSRSQSETGTSTYHSDLERQSRTRNLGSRAQSMQDSDAEAPRVSRKRRGDESETELSVARGNERALGSRCTSRATSRAGSVLSEKAERQGGEKNPSRVASVAGSTSRKVKTPSVLSDKPGSSVSANQQPHSVQSDEEQKDVTSQSRPSCTTNKVCKVLLSKYVTPVILWLGSQVMAIIVISLLNELVTYNSMIQLTNIDSMISHIGMYTSVVNSYLTTHAHMISESAQDTLVDEFNLHLHHITKIKSLLESDLDWSLQDYNNKLCVLDDRLVEHCSYLPLQLNTSVLPCQSFPIEAIQFTETDGLNAELVSLKIQSFTDSIISLITSFITMLTFYIDMVAIIHILSLVINKILHYKGLIHIIRVRKTILPVPMLEPKKSESEPVSAPSLIVSSQSDSRNASVVLGQGQSGRSSASDHSNFTNQCGQSPNTGEDEDPLLSTIKAQQDPSLKLGETSEASCLLPAEGSSLCEPSESETGL